MDLDFDAGVSLPDSDLDAILEVSGSETSDEVFSPTKDHWAVNRNDLVRLLRVFLTFPAKSTVFFALWKEGGELKMTSNNKDASVNASLPFLNKNVYDTDRVYFLNTRVLSQFISSYDSFVFSFDDNGDIYYESPYAVYKLESYSLDLASIQIKEEPNLNWKLFPITKEHIRVFMQLFSFSPKITDNKVLLSKDKIEAFFTLYLYSVRFNTGIDDNIVIRRIDLRSLYEIMDHEVQIAYTPNRTYFKFNNGILSFIRLPYSADDFQYPATFAFGNKNGTFNLDIKMLRRALRLTSTLGTNQVEFRNIAGRTDEIELCATERARFKVATGSLDASLVVSTELFSRVVSTMNDSSIFVPCLVSDNGIEFTVSGDQTNFYSLSRMTSGQLKRKEKSEKKQENRILRQDKLAKAGKLADNSAEEESSLADVLGVSL